MKKTIYICLMLAFVSIFSCVIDTDNAFLSNTANASPSASVPAYVQAEAKRVSDLARAVQNPNTFTIVAVSDLHYLKGDATVCHALNDMAFGVKAVLAQTPVDYKIAFGDYIYRKKDGYESYRDGVEEMKAVTDILNTCFGHSKNQIRLTGNHDTNSMELDRGVLKKYFTMNDLYGYLGKYNGEMVTDRVNPKGNYGYIDIPEKKIRIICLNTSDFTDEGKPSVKPDKNDYNKNTTTTQRISRRQVKWFIETLKLTGITDTEAWSILPVSHMALSETRGGVWSNSGANLNVILSEYAQKHKGKLHVKGKILSYDFKDIKPARVLPYIHGHNHTFPVKNMNVSNTFNDVVRNDMITVGLPNACPLRNGKGNTCLKTQDTAKSTVFSVIVIDLQKNVENVFSYGAGFDRTIHFDTLKMKESSTPVTLRTALQGNVVWKSQGKKVVTVSEGTVAPVSVGNTLVIATDANGNCEYWNVMVE